MSSGRSMWKQETRTPLLFLDRLTTPSCLRVSVTSQRGPVTTEDTVLSQRHIIMIMIPTELDSYHLKERLVENEDFVLIPAEAWHKLLAWYGMVEVQPALERKVNGNSTVTVTLRLRSFTMKCMSNKNQ